MAQHPMRLLGLLALLGSAGHAETIKVDARGYYTRLNDPELIELIAGRTLQPNFSRHITYENNDGSKETHWCAGSNILQEHTPLGGGGYCLALDKVGDGYWIWYEFLPGRGYSWQVMKGIGKYEGASGSGVAKAVEVLIDGSGIFHSEGTIELQ